MPLCRGAGEGVIKAGGGARGADEGGVGGGPRSGGRGEGAGNINPNVKVNFFDAQGLKVCTPSA